MKCPVCKDITLEISSRQNIEIDYCPQCRGIWLDRGELDKIIERSEVEMQQVVQPAVQQPVVQQPMNNQQYQTPPPQYQNQYPQNQQGYYDQKHYKHSKQHKMRSFLSDLFD